MRKMVAAAGLTVTALGFVGGAAGAQMASASSYPTFQTVSKTEVLISPKCVRYTQKTVTYYHWSKTAYVRYPAPKTTITTATTCHA